jgi:streptomycin 6-kinase
VVSGGAADLPDAVRRRAAAQGPESIRWLKGLGNLVADLEHEWEISVGATLHGGTMAFVAEARMADGTDAVLKVQMPDTGDFTVPGHDLFAEEVRALLVAEGRGYVRVLRHDLARRAMLQERLGRRLSDLGLPVRTQIEIICATLRQAWVPVPPDAGFQTGAEKARALATFIADTWESLSRPCAERAIAQALSFAAVRGRAFDADSAVLVHGDAHSDNTLQSRGEQPPVGSGFKFIDPDALFAERAYDLAIPMRSWSEEFLAGDALRLGRERCTYLAALTGVDVQAIWQWGFVERVSTGLLALQVGLGQLGDDMLKVAEAWAGP